MFVSRVDMRKLFFRLNVVELMLIRFRKSEFSYRFETIVRTLSVNAIFVNPRQSSGELQNCYNAQQ